MPRVSKALAIEEALNFKSKVLKSSQNGEKIVTDIQFKF